MDRAAITVRNMLAAVEAPLYDIGVLSDRGMLLGLDAIPAAATIDRLALLKYRNARGSHIYIRPSGEHRFTVLDDPTRPRSRYSRKTASILAPSSRQAPATSKPG